MLKDGQPYWNHLGDEMYPTWFLHSFVMNGKISGHVAAFGDMTGNVLCVLDAPVGCGFHYRNAARRRRKPYYGMVCSDLKEQDIIMGGDARLEKTVRDAYERYKPELIVIIPSPITDILNEDLFYVASRLQTEGIPVIAAKSERFSLPDKDYVRSLMRERGKLKIGDDNHLEVDVSGCGFNEAMCAIVDQYMESDSKIEKSVNIETISWGIEGDQIIDEIEEFLNECGITVVSRIPNSSIEEIKQASSASLNLVSHFIKWARRMKDRYGTDYLHMGESMRYDGLDGIALFYRDIAEKLDMTESMEPLIANEYEKALAETTEERALLASKKCILACRGLQEVPAQIRIYAKLFGIQVTAVCVLWTEDMKRYYYVDDSLEKQFENRLYDAVELYSPRTQVYINPSYEEFNSISEGCDGIVGTNDFTLDGRGAPVIPAYYNTMAFSFPSYVRSIKRLAGCLSRTQEKKSLILNRMGISNIDPNLFPDTSHSASREMWFKLWWDYDNPKKDVRGCCGARKKECCK